MVQILAPLKTFFIKCSRVWHVLRKPTRKEIEQTAKVSAIGILLLGVIGFVISIIIKLFVG